MSPPRRWLRALLQPTRPIFALPPLILLTPALLTLTLLTPALLTLALLTLALPLTRPAHAATPQSDAGRLNTGLPPGFRRPPVIIYPLIDQRLLADTPTDPPPPPTGR